MDRNLQRGARLANALTFLDKLAERNHSAKNETLDMVDMSDQDFDEFYIAIQEAMEHYTNKSLDSRQFRDYELRNTPGMSDMAGPDDK